MRRFALAVLVGAVVGLIPVGHPALANTKDTIVVHDDFISEIDWCGFPIEQHVFGTYTIRDYHDTTGLLYKTIITVGPGPYTQTWSAEGTTLTMQSQTFVTVIYYNADGSTKTATTHGLDLKFTLPGTGIVLQAMGTVRYDGNYQVISWTGPNQQLDGDFAKLCSAFG